MQIVDKLMLLYAGVHNRALTVASTADSSDTAGTTALASSLTCCGTPIERLCSFLIDGERTATAATATTVAQAYDWPAARLLALNTLQALTASSGAAGAGALVRTATLPLLVSYLQPPAVAVATAAATPVAAAAAAAATAAAAAPAAATAADATLAEAALRVLAVLAAAAETAVDKPLVSRRRSSASSASTSSSTNIGDVPQPPLTAAVLVAALDAADCWTAVCSALEGQFLRGVGGLVPGATAPAPAAAGLKVSYVAAAAVTSCAVRSSNELQLSTHCCELEPTMHALSQSLVGFNVDTASVSELACSALCMRTIAFTLLITHIRDHCVYHAG
jgi:hypothetical protein